VVASSRPVEAVSRTRSRRRSDTTLNGSSPHSPPRRAPRPPSHPAASAERPRHRRAGSCRHPLPRPRGPGPAHPHEPLTPSDGADQVHAHAR
jgi:hypothetical protein